MRSTKLWGAAAVLLSTLCVASCDKGDEPIPSITLTSESGQVVFNEDHTVLDLSASVETYRLQIRGGDGIYEIGNDNEDVLHAERNGTVVTLQPLAVGSTVVTVTDASGRVFSLSVNVKLNSPVSEVRSASCVIFGDDMTAQEKESLENEALAYFSGWYRYTYDIGSYLEGKVRIFPRELDGEEYLEYDFLRNGDPPAKVKPMLIHAQIYSWYIFTSGTEELALFITSGPRSRANIQFYVYYLDVTDRYRATYPTLERIYIKQDL